MKRHGTIKPHTYRRFFYCRRAAATALAAAVMTLMGIAGFALTSDHVYLVYQRDLLKAAIDSATVATTRHMALLDSSLSEEQVIAALNPIARRYILANISEGGRERAAATLEFTLYPDRVAGTVGIEAAAELGSTIVGRWLWGSITQTTRGGSKVERVGNAPEVILAFDVTNSMCLDLQGRKTANCEGGSTRSAENSRIEIVRRAATELVDLLAQAGQGTAFGLVPWSHQIRFDDATRTRLQDGSLVEYLRWRYYPYPRSRAWSISSNRPYPDPFRTHSGGEWHRVPVQPEDWNGCPDLRSMSGSTALGFSIAPPTPTVPLLMRFYTPVVPDGSLQSVSYACYAGRRENTYCYNGPSTESKHLEPQPHCSSAYPSMLPLTTSADAAKRSIAALTPVGVSTYSAVGVIWGHRLLAPSWRAIWNNTDHPRDWSATQKVLVLLTDGRDNQWARRAVQDHQAWACTAAKRAGIKIFTIAAMSRVSSGGALQKALENCSSKDDDPDGQYVFINNSTPEQLREAFRSIAAQLIRFRRLY